MKRYVMAEIRKLMVCHQSFCVFSIALALTNPLYRHPTDLQFVFQHGRPHSSSHHHHHSSSAPLPPFHRLMLALVVYDLAYVTLVLVCYSVPIFSQYYRGEFLEGNHLLGTGSICVLLN